MSSKKILITGANGQLGSALNLILGEYPSLYELINTGHQELDITDKDRVEEYIAKTLPHFVINCAAYTAVDKAESEIDIATAINVEGVRNLARAANLHKLPIIHISTDFVFDGKTSIPLVEDSFCNPINVYGSSKYKGEQAAQAENSKHFIIRTSWLYSSVGHNFLKSITKLATERSTLSIVFDQIGTPTFANDLALAVKKIIDSELAAYGVYHFSNEGVASWYDFAKELIDIQGINCEIVPIVSSEYHTPAKRPAYSVLNKSKIKATFQIEIPYWKDSLRACILEMNSVE